MRPFEEIRPVTTASSLDQGRVIEAADRGNSGEVRIDLRAHNSLTSRQARSFLITVAIGPALTAGFCLLQGFWPVLPFAGLEFGLLWFALRWSLQRGRQRELISITPDYVTINAQLSVVQANTRFPRHWTRVKLRAPQLAPHPSRLYFESQGRACEVGSFLTDDERRALAARLQQLIGNMNDAPAL
jgi:uncharacterized membrane protein